MDRNETAGWEIGADRQGRLNVYPLSSSFSFFFIFRLYVYTLRALLSFIPSLAYTPSHLLYGLDLHTPEYTVTALLDHSF